MMTTTNPNTAFKTTDSLIKTATKYPHNPIADTPARNTRDTYTLWQRCLVAIALLVTCALGVKAEKYVFYYDDGTTKYYMANVNKTLTVLTEENYDANTCVWEGTNGGKFSNNEKEIYVTYGSPYLKDAGNGSDLIIEDGTNNIYRNIGGTKAYIIYHATSANKLNYSISNNATNIKAATPPAAAPEPCTTPTINIDATTKAVTLLCIEPTDATIYYTTDGTTPTNGSNKYTVPFSITNGTKVKAIAIKDGRIDSQVSSAELSNDGAVRHLVTEEGVAAAKDCIVIGVGYPKTTSAEYRALNELTAHTKTQAEVDELVTKYKTCSDIQLPEDGKAYQFANYSLFNGGTKRYLNYTAGTALSTSTDPNDASVFVCRKLREGVYVFVTTDGKFITWMNSGEGYKGDGAFNGYSNSYSSLHSGYSDWNEITVKKNGTAIIDFGYVRMVARRFARDNDPNSSFIIKGSDGTWDKAGDNYFMQAPDDNANCYSSAWIITEVAHTNTEAQNRALEEIDAKEIEKRTIPVPGITIDDSGQTSITVAMQNCTIYYTTNGEEPTESSDIYTAPFNVTNKTIVKAIAVRSHYKTSSVASCYYVTDMAALLGEGTEASPFEISTMEQWIAFAKTVNSNSTKDYHARLTADISGYNITIKDFSGTLDGQYHTISGLNAPLFATASNATIKNIMMDNVSISAPENAGAIASTASGTTRIYNCGVLATSESNICGNNNVGSIVGELQGNARVINCYSFANITSGTTVGGIVGNNAVTYTAGTPKTLVMNCAYYGEMSGGTYKYPIFGGYNITNNQGENTYNFFRYDENTTYAGYNAAQAVFKDEYLDRFGFYQRILNSHRELAAYYAFNDVNKADEIGKWALDKTRALYPIVTKHLSNTRKTLDRTIPNTQEDYAGKKIKDINVTININGTQVYNGTLPVTDMDTARWDYTYGKIVLPFANEFTRWSIDASEAITGWEISTKDYYQDLNATFDNTEYVYAQGGNYIVPDGVESITLTAYVAPAVYLSDASYDVVYNSSYASPQGRGGATPTTYKGQTVYTNLAAAIDALTLVDNTVRPYEQAIVLVGNYHYNQRVEPDVLPSAYAYYKFNTNKPFTLMSVDNNNDQEPDYCFYQYHSVGPGRSLIHPVRFDFLTSPGIGMAAHIEEGSAVPGIGIWHCKGWYEQTETYLGIMNECEMRPANFLVESPWILNGGIFEEINVSSTNEYGNQKESKLSYIKIGGNALVNKFYPGVQHANDDSYVTTLKPVYVSGGEVKSCYMTGKQPQYTTTVGNVDFYCNGGYIHEFLGAYMEPLAADATINVHADHALIDNFYGGGANENYGTPGNINITMNNSRVNFFCGGPKYGNMSNEKTITINASGSTFGQFYGGGYGGTALTRNMKVTESPNFSGNLTYPHNFTNYTDDRLQSKALGVGVGYDFEFFLYAGGGSDGSGKGVARFFVDYARLSLATAGSIKSTLTNCTILGDYYGGGCQGRVEGNVTSTLTGCTVNGNIFAGGYTAAATPCYVYPTTQPTYSTFKSTLGIFTPFGTTTPDTYVWTQATASQAAGTVSGNTIYTDVDMTKMGEVDGNTTIKIKGSSHIHGSVFGGGNASKVIGNTHVHIQGGTIDGNVFGAGNQAEVTGKTEVVIGE